MELKKHTHEERVRIAKEICEKIVQSDNEHLVAVYIIGSTAKGLDRAYSDLEMIAVLGDGPDGDPSMKYYLYDGLVVNVEYRRESYTLRDAEHVTREWPLVADEAHNRIILFERDQFFSRLDQVADRAARSDMNEVVGFGMVGMYETLGTILNSISEKDEMAIRSAGSYLAVDAAKLVMLLNRKFLLTTTWFWKEARKCPVKPDNFWTCVEKLAGFTTASVAEIQKSAEALCEDMLKIVEGRGITIESSRIIV